MILFTKFRTGSLDHMSRGSDVVLRKIKQNNDYISLRNCPGRLSSFRRFGARCDDAHHFEQNGVVFEAKFCAKVIEVYPRALELCTAWASLSESPLRAPFGRIDGMVATPSAIAAPQRVVASNFFKVVLRKRR